MKKLFLIICLLALVVAGTGSTAQVSKQATIKFVMPTGVDPFQYAFTFDGETFTGIPGSQLLGLGIELLVPDTSNIQLGRFVVQTTYAGGITFNIEVDPDSRFSSLAPWLYTPLSPSSADLDAQPGSGKVGETLPNKPGDRFFARLFLDSIDPADQTAFNNSTFTITGFIAAVPEPGSVAMLAGIVIAGGTALRIRRRSRP